MRITPSPYHPHQRTTFKASEYKKDFKPDSWSSGWSFSARSFTRPFRKALDEEELWSESPKFYGPAWSWACFWFLWGALLALGGFWDSILMLTSILISDIASFPIFAELFTDSSSSTLKPTCSNTFDSKWPYGTHDELPFFCRPSCGGSQHCLSCLIFFCQWLGYKHISL